MKITIQDILLVVIVGLLVWFLFFSPKDKITEPQPIQVVIPGSQGTTGTQVIETSQPYPVYIQGQGQVIVDEKYKLLYEKAKDSLEQANLYLNAIKINEYKRTFIDNDTISITGDIKTRGDLLEYKFDYDIKDRVFEYEPKVIKERPRFSLDVGVSAGVPTIPTSRFNMRGDIGLQNRRGETLIVGYDTDQRVWLGLKKNIVIWK